MNKLVFVVVLLGISLSSATYNLKASWNGEQIIDTWNYFTGADPTHGYVFYASQSQAKSWGYCYVNNLGHAIIKSDDTSISSGSGRGSVRVTSPIAFSKGILLADIIHMPWGQGTWPAFWTTEGTNWPAGGEIDIIEGVNSNNGNQMTLHTSPGCTVPTTKTAETGNPGLGDCGANGGTSGCGISDPDTWSYGNDFNNNGGGVWAMQWEDSGVYIWEWTHQYIPADVLAGTPNPANWGNPRGRFTFNQGCSAEQYFYNHGIIFDNTFCGDWAGNVYPGGNGACQNFVQNNPSAFTDAYWEINYVKLYQQ